MHARAPPLLDIEAEMKLVLDSKETFGENLVSKKMKDFGLERLFSLLINFLGEKVIVGIVVKIQNWSFPCICKQQLMTVVTLFVFLPGLNVPSEVLTGKSGFAAAAASGVSGSDFGIDPNLDPELALAFRVCMADERA
ncbi:uncharacterized protein LOC113276517 [Papaver somniferum]|uniref:uncharacterized protein LOC113276517 n=1 Tax=Papaver somniferum TaxID=3469 RepID=UPI000E6FDAF5|nr:uncharacterized protein LOC113276517 [Papaver somniferum]XP_026381920.1 uncharacterized protein LOC113276517 [Papaver somniferum]XP_026381921.1 uncharacterized protein LOC113276517 [Papaver somniferum]